MKIMYSAREISEKLGRPRGLVYELAKRNKLPSIRIGKNVFFPKKEIDKILEYTP